MAGVWSITPPATQYSEVTLGAVASGGGGPIVRIDRNNAGQTGWLLLLLASNPGSSGIYKLTPDRALRGGARLHAHVGPGRQVAADRRRGPARSLSKTVPSQFTYTTRRLLSHGGRGDSACLPRRLPSQAGRAGTPRARRNSSYEAPRSTGLHAGDRVRRGPRHDQRHELHRDHGGQLQRESGEFPGELRDDDLRACADERHDRDAERHDAWRHRGRQAGATSLSLPLSGPTRSR